MNSRRRGSAGAASECRLVGHQRQLVDKDEGGGGQIRGCGEVTLHGVDNGGWNGVGMVQYQTQRDTVKILTNLEKNVELEHRGACRAK